MCRAVLTSMGVVEDPFASRMLHAGPRAAARVLRLWPFSRLARSATFSFLAARTRFFDDAVTGALDRGVEQVVLVGAGYDSRSWRLARPGVRFFEVDHPATQRDKSRVAPAAGPTYVVADLCRDALDTVLPAAGFKRDQSAVFIVEGLTMYLPEPVVLRVLGTLAALSSPTSELAANFTVKGGGSVSPVSRMVAWATRWTWKIRGEQSHRWASTDPLPDVLAQTGWNVTELVTAPVLARRYLTGTRLRLDGLNVGAICVAAVRNSAA